MRQVELFSHQSVVQEILQALQKELDLRLCSVHLIDSFYCSQPATFISATLLVTATMLRLELPHVNVLSKVRTAAPRHSLWGQCGAAIA